MANYVVALFQDLRDLSFDHLQYANREGEGLGDLVTCHDVRQTEVRGQRADSQGVASSQL